VRIYYSSRFEKSIKKLPGEIKELFIKKIGIFKEDQNQTSLKTHRLRGKLDQYYAFSVNYQYRVMFSLEGDGVTLLDIGTHKIYK